MKLKKQSRFEGIIKICITIDCINLNLIQQLNPCHRNSHLNCRDCGVHRTFHSFKGTDCSRNCFRDSIKSKLNFRYDSQCSFGANKQACQIIARGRFTSAGTGSDYTPVCSNHCQAKHIFPHGSVAYSVCSGGASCRHSSQ